MTYEDDARTLNFVAGFALGAVVGAGIALFLSAEKAAPTRRAIRVRAGALREGATERFDRLTSDLRGKLEEVVDTAREGLSSS